MAIDTVIKVLTRELQEQAQALAAQNIDFDDEEEEEGAQ